MSNATSNLHITSEHIDAIERHTVVSCPRGSWKWQNAYRVVSYRMHRTRDGRMVWKSYARLTGKLSEPQIRRNGYGNLPVGSLHHKPVSDADLAIIAAASGDCDYRPTCVIPEDYHAN